MILMLRKLFINDYNNLKNQQVRVAHGKLACLVGIISNVILFIIKLIIGILGSSISIIADSINNLSDMTSSLITLVCFRISAKPADKEHPYGHERVEYIATLIVSIIIIIVGAQLAYQSVLRILENKKTNISYLTIIILFVSIIVKVWQSVFNYRIGRIIDSLTLVATSVDSRNDVISTTVILVGTTISLIWPNVHLDGYFGILIAIFIIYSGGKLIKSSTDTLIGKTPDPEFIKQIVDEIKEYDSLVLGVHDPVCHVYGATKKFMSVHVEVSASGDLLETHDVIDNIEKLIFNKYGIELVIHMDPIELECPLTSELRELMINTLLEISENLSLHDFRILKNNPPKIAFDVVIPANLKVEEEEIKNILQNALSRTDIEMTINFDRNYIL